jgi:serine/threonine protein kinase
MGHLSEPSSPRMPPGAQVGAWRVEELQGHGAYGAVYRAVRVGQERSGPVALKVALHSWDKRFGREVELLSRLSHPGVPRLLDHGLLRHGSGAEYAFFVMEWVEGTRLYAWAEQCAPSGWEVRRVLARLARALEAVHAAGAVHRDVKGDNVLVRQSDRSPVLLDFGSCHYPGAERLTWQSLAPFTPEYLSPQACLFDIRLARERDGYYVPTPADDLFALGVTAYRLVMGEYPPPMKVQQDGQGAWHVSSRDPRPLLERNDRVEPLLREWILRLLSDEPEERGTAAELAKALEAAAGDGVAPQQGPASRPASEVPVPALPVPVVTAEKPERPRTLVSVRAWKPWLALAAVGVSAVLLWSTRPAPLPPEHVWVSTPRWVESQVPDAGTAGVGDTSPAEPEASAPPASEGEPIAQEPDSVPRPGPRQQIQPDKKGRCPGSMQVAFDGGCWVEQPTMTAEACVQGGYMLRKGKCYTPVLESPQKSVPTSSPAEGR